MGKKRYEGGPAFPLHVTDGTSDLEGDLVFPGLSVRDYFAAKALPACVEREFGDRGTHQHNCVPSARSIALDAYAIADAMLRARDE